MTKFVPESIQSVKSSIVLIYPNPFKDYITIESLRGGHLKVYSIDGKLQMNIEVKLPKEMVNIAELTSGNYLLEFSDKSGRKELMKMTRE